MVSERGGRRSSHPERSRGTRWLALLPVLSLSLASVRAWAGNMEGPLSGTRPLGAPPAEDYRLERIRFENDGEWLRMTIPTKAPWAHWTLADPPRIIVDLGQTTSHLSNAPGVYQARLDRGPVRSVRTSQFMYSPLDHRVRITLDMSQVLPYQARRVGDDIQILIPDRGVRTPRVVVIGPTGISGVEGDRAAAAESAPAPAEGSQVGAPPTTSLFQTRSNAPRPDAVPSDAGPDGTISTAGSRAAGAIPSSSGNAAVSAEGIAGGADRPPARTLREALAEFGAIGVEPVSEDEMEPPSMIPGKNSVTPAKKTTAPARPAHATPARTRATLVPASSPGASSSAPSSPAASVREAPPAGEASPDAAPDLAPAIDPKERSAARLLRQAVLATLHGDLKAAGATAARAHGFYAGTASGDQCGFLAREVYLLQGKTADAEQLAGLPALPDSTRLPRALYLSFVDHYRQAGDPAGVDRVLRQWGPAYSPLPGLGALHYAMGEGFLRAGDVAAAEQHLRLIGPGDSLHAPALLLIALVQDRRGERESALETYRQVTALGAGPFQARGLARAADLEFQLGRVREAMASYERLLQASPPHDEEVWAVYQVGNCHLLLGESDAARERYETVAKLWPQSFWAPFVKERLEEMTWRAQWVSGSAAR
jgi:tetratricopeptide (TPR) repeat protein